MDYEFSGNDARLVDETVRIVREVLAGAAPLEGLGPDDFWVLERRVAPALAELGYLADGLVDGKPFRAATMAAMSGFAANAPSFFIAFETGARVFGRLLQRYGDEEQKRGFLDPLLKGDVTAAVALCEKTLNVVNDPLETVGRREDGRIRVYGEKGFVVNGLAANVIAVVGRLDDGLGVFLVDRETPGVRFSDIDLDDDYRQLCACSLSLDGCVVPDERVIGPLDGQRLVSDLRLWEDQVLVAAAVGITDAALFEAALYAKSHRSGGKPVIAYQEVGFRLAEMYMLAETSRLMAFKAGWLDSLGDRQTGVFTDCAKVFCTEAAEQVAGGALRVLSKRGMEAGSVAREAYKWAKYLQAAGTSADIARMRIGDDSL